MTSPLLRQLFLTKSARSFSPWRLSYLRSLPQEPGIYVFRDEHNQPLYVGKSKNLKARISSYFHSQHVLQPKTTAFVPQVRAVDLITVGTELEAILLEARLINELQPKYNSRLRDDKSPIYIVVTDEEFPRVLQLRRSVIARNPGVRRGDVAISSKTDRHGHVRRGLAMTPYAKVVIGPFLSSRQIGLILKKSRHLFPYCNKAKKDGKPCFYAHLELCPGACTGKINSLQYRRTIRKLVRFLRGDINALRASVQSEMRRLSLLQHYEAALSQKNIVDALEHMLTEPIREESSILFNQQTSPQKSLILMLTASAVIPNYPTASFRIEGYDVSNLKGRQATGSMVVFTNGVSTSSEYRIFRIRGENETTGDDPRMLSEVLRRRFLHPEWEKPQLVLIDGGEPQLRQIQKEFKVTTTLPGNIPFLGLTKGEEILVIPKPVSLRGVLSLSKGDVAISNDFFHLKLPRNDPGLLLLMHIRDESHRFARIYHHWLRKKTILG